MNKLVGMLAFARVAEYGGFTSAARRLGVSVSAVAKLVARLEDELGVHLVERTTRRVSLTDLGRAYYPKCAQILSDLEEVEAVLKQAQGTPRGTIRLATTVSFGRATLLPQLGEFNRRYPEIRVETVFADAPVGYLRQGFELVVHVGDLNNSGLVARLLNRGPRVCAASPEYLERHGDLMRPQDLAAHNCIVHSPGPRWPFRIGGRRVEVVVKGNLVVDSGDALREAVLLGLGIGQTNWWTFRHDFASGRLAPLLQEYSVEGRPISVVYQRSRHMSLKLRAMIDFLVEITTPPERKRRGLKPACERAAVAR